MTSSRSKDKVKYDNQLIKFFLSEGFSNIKTNHLSFKVLLRKRYNLFLEIEKFKRQINKKITLSKIETDIFKIYKEIKSIIQCLNDLSSGRYRWLYPLLENLKKEIKEECLSQENRVGCLPLEEIDFSLKDKIGIPAAQLGEIKNKLDIPVPPGIVIPLSQGVLKKQYEEEIEQCIKRWGHPATISIQISPLNKEFWLLPKLEVLTRIWKEELLIVLEDIKYQIQTWQTYVGKESSLEGSIIIQKSMKPKLSGILYTSNPSCPEQPLIFLKDNKNFLLIEDNKPPFIESLLSYAERIKSYFKEDIILGWEVDENEKIYICQCVPINSPILKFSFQSERKIRTDSRKDFQKSISISEEAFFNDLKEKITSLTIALPESEDLAVVVNPKEFKTFRDLSFFSHEAAVRELFLLEKEGPLHILKDPRIPITFYLLDIGDGVHQQALFKREITISDICSLPLLILWRGMTHEDVDWKGAVEFNLGGFFSVLSRSFIETSVKREGGKGYFVVARDYLYLRLRLAYHLMNVEAFFREEGDNYLIFRLQGGGAGSSGRHQRLLLLRDILEPLGFEVEITSDLICGLYLGPRDKKLEITLNYLGRLLAFTRQLDMTLHDQEKRKTYVETFLKDYYRQITKIENS